MEIQTVVMRINHLLRHLDLRGDEIIFWEIDYVIDRIRSSHIHFFCLIISIVVVVVIGRHSASCH